MSGENKDLQLGRSVRELHEAKTNSICLGKHLCDIADELCGISSILRREKVGWIDPSTYPTAEDLNKLLTDFNDTRKQMDKQRSFLKELGYEL